MGKEEGDRGWERWGDAKSSNVSVKDIWSLLQGSFNEKIHMIIETDNGRFPY